MLDNMMIDVMHDRFINDDYHYDHAHAYTRHDILHVVPFGVLLVFFF